MQYQNHWELEQKKAKNTEVPKFDKSDWAKPMENIVLHLKLVRGVRGTLLAYFVWCHIKVAHISSGYDAYLNLDKEMITAPIVNSKLNLKLNQELLDMVYLDYQDDMFKIDNALVY